MLIFDICIRSIGCFLILLFHIYWFNHFSVHNVTMTFSYGEQALFQWISATPIIVDVFFTISGLLLSYNFLRNQSKLEEIRTNTLTQNLKLMGKQLLNRYIRYVVKLETIQHHQCIRQFDNDVLFFFVFQINSDVFGCCGLYGIHNSTIGGNITILDTWPQRCQLQQVLVAKFALHSKFVQPRWALCELVLVIGMRNAILYRVHRSPILLCKVSFFLGLHFFSDNWNWNWN